MSRVGTVLATAADGLRVVAVLLNATMPATAQRMWDMLGAEADAWEALAAQRIQDAGRVGTAARWCRAHQGGRAVPPARGGANRMTDDERAALVARYRSGVDDVLDALEDVTEETSTADRPTPDAWSAREVVHHLADSETNSYLRLRRLVGRRGHAGDRWLRRGGLGDAAALRRSTRRGRRSRCSSRSARPAPS